MPGRTETVQQQMADVCPPELIMYVLTPVAFLATSHRDEAINRVRMEILAALENSGITRTEELLALSADELLEMLGHPDRVSNVEACLGTHGLHLATTEGD